MSEVNQVQSTSEETRHFWRSVAQKLIQDSVSALERAAIQSLMVNAVLIGFYVNVIAFSGMQGKARVALSWITILLPLCMWFGSVIMSVSVFWPKAYSINLQSSIGSKESIERIVRSKHLRLRSAFVLLVSGILILAGVLLGYLSGKLPLG